jgi:HAD superfamily hydrolase (TIGR01509 family)
VIQAVVFDLDGLMIDSEPLALEAWQVSLAPYGAKLTDELYRALIGLSHEVSLRLVVEQTGTTIYTEKFDREYHENLLALIDSDRLKPMPGLLPLLDDLEARGFALGVASNSTSRHVQLATARLGIARRFGCMVSAEEVPVGKPAPDVYLEAASRLGVDPARCLAFEDSPSGVQAAQRAGMYCVFVPNPDLSITSFDGVEDLYPSLTACHAVLDDVLLRASRTDWRGRA